MLRRLARERREYLYRKSIEDKRRTIEEKKERLKQALEENRPIPYELREEALNLQRALDWDDPGGEGVVSHEDDEYRWAGVRDPKIVVTTSRDPSSKLKQFAKEIRLIFPNAQRMNRGGYEMKQLIEACRANEVTDFIVVHETRGNPDGLVVCHLPYGPTAYFTILNTVMRHDIPNIGTMSEAYPHLIFHNFKTRLGKRRRDVVCFAAAICGIEFCVLGAMAPQSVSSREPGGVKRRGKYMTLTMEKKAAIFKLIESGRSQLDVAR
ncbi:hypothetical protein HPB51_002582 [Rhipicephalus microplus]|uniref:Brix domain-containing protein n=1 Tax=Rhipicephalus microplus TaxID=6941 RepID=A0A9J6DFB7_RHIMP|nr:hypothetical protein HPB51_002582 [Rhipicephalus microplus]